MFTLRRRTLGAMLGAALGLAALGLTTLGAGNDKPADQRGLRLVRQAPDVALQSKRFQMEMAISLVPKHGPTHSTTETAVLDVAHRRASLLLADVVSPRQGGWRMVSQDNVLYVLLGPSQARQYPGKSWVSIKLPTAMAAQGAAVGPIPDPLSFLAGLRGVEGSVRRVGSSSLDGTPATGYAAVINMQAMSTAVGPEGASQVQALRRLGVPDLPVTVWLDAKGRPREIDVRADLGAQGSIVAQVRFDAFGEPVVIGIPRDADVVHATSLAEALELAGISSS